MHPLLELKDVCFSYHTPQGETVALSHISFSVAQGEFLAIVGPSGCGKSTILNLICGLLSPEKGEILFHGEASGGRTANIGYMLQKDHLLEWRTIWQNVILGLQIQRLLAPDRLQLVREMLKTYGLEKFRDAYPSQLSGGMRQRAALIRTLALQPDLLLLDEPFSALDYQTRLNVGDDIGKIIRRESKTAVLVTHDISEAVSMADKVLILTRRPATVKSLIPIQLGLTEPSPLAARNAAEFKMYFNLIWKELNDHVSDVERPDAVPAAAKTQ